MAFCLAALVLSIVIFCPVKSKVYDRCELAVELRDVYEFPANQLATWICIANYESHFNTSAHNPGSGDHGLFQISELFWCSPGMDLACAVSCSDLKDDNIEDDVICAKRIYRQHQRISGNGFTAWVVYNLYCNNQAHADKFLNGCFTKENLVKHQKSTTETIASPLGKNELFKKIDKTTSKTEVIQKSTILSSIKPSTTVPSSTTAFSKFKSFTSIASGNPIYYRKFNSIESISKPTVTTSLPKITPRSTQRTTSLLPTKREEKRENRNFFVKFSNDDADRSVNLKPREAKVSDYPSFANNDGSLYAVINRSDYQFTLTSHGFSFVRT